MITLPLSGYRFSLRTTLSIFALLACLASGALGANSVSGTVRNQTRGQPSVGDEVILVRVDDGMHEEARTKTDAMGTFTLQVRYPGKPYLVRVVHEQVNYDRHVAAGEALSIEVFDAAPKVSGITGSIEILRAGTNGKLLHISDLYEIRNESSPPVTQSGDSTFEVYLPANARIDSVLAGGPDKIGVMIAAVPVPAEPGRYTVSFPLRPGSTKFAFNYDLPYDGHAVFRTRHLYPLQQLAVMIPPTMKFSSSSRAFEVLPTRDAQYQVEAAGKLNAGEGPAFEVSGTGTLPALGNQAKSQTRSLSPPRPSSSKPATARVAIPSLPANDLRLERAESGSQSLVIAGLTIVLMATCALLAWRAHKLRSISPAATIPVRAVQVHRPITLLEALQQELKRLEADKRRGLISREEYTSTQQALEETLKRAVARAG